MAWYDKIGDVAGAAWGKASDFGSAAKKWALGESSEEAERRLMEQNPELARAQARRASLEKLLAGEAAGTAETPGQRAIMGAMRQAQGDVYGQARSQVAGARGLGKLLAQQTAGGQAAQAATRIAGESARAAGLQRAGETQASRAALMSLLTDEERAAMMRQQLTEAGKKGGALPGLLAAGGGIAGGYLGGAQGAQMGAQIGGTVGSAVQR